MSKISPSLHMDPVAYKIRDHLGNDWCQHVETLPNDGPFEQARSQFLGSVPGKANIFFAVLSYSYKQRATQQVVSHFQRFGLYSDTRRTNSPGAHVFAIRRAFIHRLAEDFEDTLDELGFDEVQVTRAEIKHVNQIEFLSFAQPQNIMTILDSSTVER